LTPNCLNKRFKNARTHPAGFVKGNGAFAEFWKIVLWARFALPSRRATMKECCFGKEQLVPISHRQESRGVAISLLKV
jgi:hypothetical protein